MGSRSVPSPALTMSAAAAGSGTLRGAVSKASVSKTSAEVEASSSATTERVEASNVMECKPEGDGVTEPLGGVEVSGDETEDSGSTLTESASSGELLSEHPDTSRHADAEATATSVRHGVRRSFMDPPVLCFEFSGATSFAPSLPDGFGEERAGPPDRLTAAAAVPCSRGNDEEFFS